VRLFLGSIETLRPSAVVTATGITPGAALALVRAWQLAGESSEHRTPFVYEIALRGCGATSTSPDR
jgi:hypothetical protein